MKRTPIRTRRTTPRRMSTRDDHGPIPGSPDGSWAATRELIYWRAGGRCEICGDTLHGSMEGHHRLKRRYGPDCPCNALALCTQCHHGRVHGHPTAAVAEGWMLSSVRLSTIPADEPVTILGRLDYLHCDGAYRFGFTGGDPAGSVATEHPSREGASREDTQ